MFSPSFQKQRSASFPSPSCYVLPRWRCLPANSHSLIMKMSSLLTWWCWRRMTLAVKGGRWQTGNVSIHMATGTPSPLPSVLLIRDLLTSSLSNHRQGTETAPRSVCPDEARSITGLSWKCGGKWESDDGSGNVGGYGGRYITVLSISMLPHLSLL